MKTSMQLFVGLMLLGLAGLLPATVSVSRLEGFNKTWQFINTDTTYSEIESFPSGYFMDYDGDGIPDYLICQKSGTGSMRLFTLNTAATGGDGLAGLGVHHGLDLREDLATAAHPRHLFRYTRRLRLRLLRHTSLHRQLIHLMGR